MPEHGTVRSVLVLEAGPQACRALTDLGLRVVLVDPDPGTVTTDPGFADVTYAEPVTPESVENVIARERPDALLPALDGRVALDTAVALHEAGTLDRYGVRLLGADAGALHRAAEAVAAGAAVAGGRRYGLQLVRDRNDDIEVVCAFETFDLPDGGGTITVAPARTPTTRVYETLRDVGRAVVREIGAGAGGCTLWCAVHPESGRVTVLDVDPRGAREAALVACATGLPMAGICAELAVGRTLDETPVRSRPAPGHVAVRAVAPSGAETLAVGHTVTGALQEALVRLHGGAALEVTGAGRAEIDSWLAEQLSVIRKVADELVAAPELTRELVAEVKRHGFRDRRIGELRGLREDVVREIRCALGVRSVPPLLGPDRCRDGRGPAGGRTRTKPAVIVLGQDGGGSAHAWLQACAALRAAGHETVVVGSAPASPDGDERAADRFYCAPLTTEAVLEVVHAERRGGPVAGVCVQFGGADATRLARDLADQGVRVLGTPVSAVRATEEHDTFQRLLRTAGLSAVRYMTASSPAEARAAAESVEYPVTVGWAGGRGGWGGGEEGRTGGGSPELVPDAGALASLLALPGSAGGAWPVVIGQVVRDAVEVAVDALFDGEEVYLGGVLERLGWVDASDAGAVHVLPAVTLGGQDLERVRAATRVLAGALGVRGALTVRCALAGGVLQVRGAEPRVSGTVPFTSQATGVPLARAAARIALGTSVAELRAEGLLRPTGDGATLPPDTPVAVAQTLPGTGAATGIGTEPGSGEAAAGIGNAGRGREAMGVGEAFGFAYAKSRAAVGGPLPTKGRALLSIADRDRRSVIFPARELAALGFELLATGGLAGLLRRNGVKAGVAHAIGRTSAARLVRDEQIDLVVVTHHRGEAPAEGQGVLAAALAQGVPCLTTVRDLAAAVQGIDALRRPRERTRLRPLQDWQSRQSRTTH
ncbi:carbamoyl phosphate synthase large subunit [Streptomyces sp. NBC_00663]|uniref:carbamoyl phosphate synthase preATP-grasp domain-containing protein n=1 Tax=Streptomyces sp. NBC_00663 TaxID=2975801 RepID=UPI002E2EF046|nr:carbamoyl phosphate synthase large subunit [Streptomyces sp. NBC_00663]